MRKLCVFCGSATGHAPHFAAAARAFGAALAARGVGLVYGGGRVGLMGVLADSVLAGGGTVHGVIPAGLEGRELAHRGLTELEVTPSMHTRKARMATLADGFVALPGGFGTFDELFEVMTWAQLGLHDRPIGVLDVAGYFGPLRALITSALAAGFVQPAFAELVRFDDDGERLLDALGVGARPGA